MWDSLILPPDTLRQLQTLAKRLAQPEEGLEFQPKALAGALLWGPPGTGKTTIAQVLASQLVGEVGFLQAKGSDIKSRWVGESVKNVRDLFDKARAQTPCIIFIDEIDALLPVRGVGSNPEDGAVLTEFLQQLDGIDSTPGVFVLGATNVPDRVDPAVLRGHRLGRRIEIPLPDERSRLRLFKLFSAGTPLAAHLDFKRLAALTGGMGGADIKSLSNEAAELALGRDEGPRQITQADYEKALAGYRVAGRPRGPRTMPPTERGAGDQIR